MASDDSPADHHRRSHPNLPRTPPPDPKWPGIPPFHPHYTSPVPATAVGHLHARSLSQPASFSFDALPPLSPVPPRELPASSSLSDPIAGADAAVDDSAGSAPSFAARPPRKTHRRSASDMSSCSFSGADALSGGLPAFVKSEGQAVSDDLFAAFFNLDFINSGDFLENRDDKDSGASGTKHNREDSSENEVESSMEVSDGSLEKKGSQKRSFGTVGGPRHSRSLSVDSFMGNLPNFSDELLRLPPSPSPSPGVASGQHSRSNSFDGSSNLFGIDQGSGDFSGADIKKIMANEKLLEIAASDPKRAKRILANRQSAARSKERKMRYISELENKVQTLQTEATTLSTQLTMLQRDSAGLNSQNNELRFRLQSMEQQAQLRDALNEALTSEVRHLKLAAQDITTSISNNRMGQQVHGHSQLYPTRQQPMQPFYQLQQQHLQPMQQLSQTPQQQEQLKQQPPEQSQQYPNSPATMREQDK